MTHPYCISDADVIWEKCGIFPICALGPNADEVIHTHTYRYMSAHIHCHLNYSYCYTLVNNTELFEDVG